MSGSEECMLVICLDKCLPFLSVIQYYNQYPFLFKTRRFCHRMRVSGHSFDICTGHIRLACARSRLKKRLYSGRCNATVSWSMITWADSPFVWMHEKVSWSCRLFSLAAMYMQILDFDHFDTSGFVLDFKFCCLDLFLN